MLRAIIFDLDDTLYAERHYAQSGFRAAAAWAEEAFDIPAEGVFADLWRLFEAGERGHTFDQWLAQRGLPMHHTIDLVRVYREHSPKIDPFEGVPALLSRLHSRFRLGLLSDGYALGQRKKVQALGLADRFDLMLLTDELGQDSWKPHPVAFARALQHWAIRGPDAIYVADNPHKDFLGAREVGMWTARVRVPEGLYTMLEPPSPAYAPHVEIPHPTALDAVLAQVEAQ